MPGKLLPVLCVLLAALTACGGQPADPGPNATGRPTPTPLPVSAAWTEPSAPVTLASVQRLRELGTLAAPEPPSTVFNAALSLDQTLLAGLNQNMLLMWSLVDGERVFSVPHLGAVHVFFSPEKDELLTLDAQARLNIISLANGATRATLNAHPQFSGATAYLPLDGLLALGGSDTTFKVWDVVERVSRVTQPTTQVVTGLAFSNDARLLAVAGENGRVQLWDWAARRATPALSIETLAPVSGLAFSPDDRYLVTASPDSAIVWSVEDGALLHRLNTGGYGDVFRFVPDSPYLLTNSGTPELLIWDVEQGRVAAIVNRQGQDRVSVAVSPDGTLLYVAELGAGAALWSLENLAQGSVGRSTRAVNTSASLFNVMWADDSFAVLFFDTRGFVSVWGVAD